MMRLSRLALLLVLFFYMAFLVYGKVETTSTTELVVGSGNSLNLVSWALPLYLSLYICVYIYIYMYKSIYM